MPSASCAEGLARSGADRRPHSPCPLRLAPPHVSSAAFFCAVHFRRRSPRPTISTSANSPPSGATEGRSRGARDQRSPLLSPHVADRTHASPDNLRVVWTPGTLPSQEVSRFQPPSALKRMDWTTSASARSPPDGPEDPSVRARLRPCPRRVEPCDHGLEHAADVRPRRRALSQNRAIRA